MPRKGRRSEAAKTRWKKMDIEGIPCLAAPRTPPLTVRTPTQPPLEKMSRLLDFTDEKGPDTNNQDKPFPTSFGSRHGMGRSHPEHTWRSSSVIDKDEQKASCSFQRGDVCQQVITGRRVDKQKANVRRHKQPDSSNRTLERQQVSASETCVSGPRVLSVRATHCQGDERYSTFSRNCQCTCVALTFLAYHNEGLQFDTALLDRVIEQGDALYVGIKTQLIIDRTFRQNYLSSEEMPKQVLTEENIYSVLPGNVGFGCIFEPTTGRDNIGGGLASQVKRLSQDVTHAYIIVNPECIAVFRNRDGRFGIFDSHSRGAGGLPHYNGVAIMMTFRSLDDLIHHLHTLFGERGPTAAYEFFPVSFVTNSVDDAPSQDLVDISPEPISPAGPAVQNPGTVSDEEETVSALLGPTLPAGPTVQEEDSSSDEEETVIALHGPTPPAVPTVQEEDTVFDEEESVSALYEPTPPAGPTEQNSGTTSDKQEMPTWHQEEANMLAETAPTIPDFSKVPKAKRRKARYQVKAQLGQNETKKKRQSTSERERYHKSPTYRTTKLQASEKTYIAKKAEKLAQLNKEYENNPVFRTKRKNYEMFRYNFVLNFRAKHKAFMADYVRRRLRNDPVFRSQHTLHIRERFRNDPVFRRQHTLRVRERFRNDPVFRRQHTLRMRERFRNDPVSRKKNRLRIRELFRNDPVFRRQHIEFMRKYEKERYHSKSEYRVEHNKKCAASKKIRLSKEVLSKNLDLHCALHIKRKYRRNVSFRKESPQPLMSKEMEAAIETFHEKIKAGPTHACTVCHRALFPGQVKHCNRGKYTKNLRVVNDCLTGIYVHVCGHECSAPCSVPKQRTQEWICYTCDSHLTRGAMPPIAAANNMHLAPIPRELAELNVLERQLIAKILPFAKIVSLPKGQQRAIHGAVVCVPSEMETIVNTLPRPSAEAQLLQVKLKRKIKYKGHQHFYTVNMKNVLAGLRKLKESHCEYSDVTINESVTYEEFQEDQPVEESEPQAEDSEANPVTKEQAHHIGEEHQALRPGLELDTCMQPLDIAQEVLSYGDGVFSIAPAQGNKPVSFFSVPRLEAKAFPVQFPTGKNTLDEARRVVLSPSMYFNTRLFSIDTRFARDQSYLFFAQFVTETHMANNSMSIQTRKGKTTTKGGQNISSKMLQDKEELEKLIQNKEATRFMQPLRGTPAYWEKGLRDLHAMVRQLGKPTFFVTFSAAEMRWPEIIEAIKAQDGEQVTFSELDWNAKCDILRSNPVTVMRMFEKRVDALFRDLLLSPAQPVGPVEDFFFRIEYQARGSPHVHAVLWISDAPEMEDPACCDKVVSFIDRYICCQLPDETKDPELHKIVSEVQMHSKKHSKSCKKGNVQCRFGFPKLPMDCTRITVPVLPDIGELENDDEKTKQDEQKEANKNRSKMKSFFTNQQREAKRKLKPIRDLLMDEKSSFKDLSELLDACKMSKGEYDHYVDSLSSGMVVMMKRDLKDIWVNGYNPDLLRAWNANMDIQYVLDEYSCIEYMMSYIAKPEHEMAEFLKSVVQDLKKSNVNQKEEMKKIMQAYSKQREVSAQESVARTCSLPLKRSSRSVIFIQTDEDGVKMSLPMSKLMTMAPEEENVWMMGLPEKYLNRPETKEFQHMCLAEFVSEYRVLYGRQIEGPNAIPLLNEAGYIQKRTHGKPAVIRYTRFSEKKTPEKFYRRLLKLYLPHRQDEDLRNEEHTTYQAFYNNGLYDRSPVKKLVEINRKRYEGQGKKIDKIMKELQKQGPIRNAWNTFAPEVEVDRLECVAERPQAEQDEQDPVPDYQMDLNSEAMPAIEAPKLSPDFIRQMYQSLNETQASIFYAIRQWCLLRVWGQDPEPFFYFLTGGAGCGKSHVIRCVYQEATKLLRQLPRFREIGDMSVPTVLLTAFTGTAAFNISGKTLHSLLKLPKSLKPPYQGLGNTLDEVRAVLGSVEILIIDEISMVSKELLAYVHWRLQQIKGNRMPFGGISLLAVGDFYQLPPMGGSKPLCVLEEGMLDLFHEHFHVVSLTEIMRQKDDRAFAELLNRLRVKGKADSLSDVDRTLLMQTVTDPKDCPKDVLHIYATNKQVDTHNATVVASLDTVIVDIQAEDYKKDKKTGNMKSLGCCVKGRKKDLPDNLQAGLGIRVMIVRNLDVEDGLVNGTFGTIADITTSKDPGAPVKLLGLILDNPTAGRTKRLRGKPDNIVYIERFEEQTCIRGVVRKQFPIKLAFGCTAHKVQGMTLKSAVVSLKRVFEHGMAYVALSRTTSLEGLKIIDYDENKIYADEKIRTAMESMRPASFVNIRPLLYFHSLHQHATLSVVHHNVEGLICHSEDMKRHHELRSADVLCLTETHLFGSSVPSSCQMEGYSFFSRNRHVSYSSRVDIATKEGGGVATYCRTLLQPQERRYFNNVTDLEFSVVKVCAPITALIATVYRPPSYDLTTFLSNMQSLLDGLNSMDVQPVVVLGDFNEDLISPGKKSINELFKDKGYMQIISDPTTEKRTLIDHIYISQPEYCLQSGVLQSYYSYHNPVYCMLASPQTTS